MGLRLRLKAGYDQPIQVILLAMNKYGIILADTGSDMFKSGDQHDSWDGEILH